ncbi:nucleolar protein dao-5 isoform X2 [Odontomachus brunneus]|uniref:nucleolar protein dao-5 isoform X2 n=1 Tax=Odontomachus brunneus TaxID=486640 RepID=UPI0013F2A973|nr:nucleolar protein dao-5 isoform X2 [Odontomachus brunneus]
MDSQETANNMAEPASGHGGTTVKPNAPLPPQGFQARPQGLPISPRNSINNGPIGAPRAGPPLRRLDSRSSLGPPASGQFVQLRPYGPPRPPGGSFPPRPPQPGQLPPQNPLHPASQRFAHSPGIRGPPPQASGQRPLFVGNYQQAQQQQQQHQQQQQQYQPRSNDPRFQRPPPDIAQNGPPRNAEAAPYRPGQDSAFPRQLLRNDSLLSLQRQHLLSNEEIKQPTRPRIVIERMADIDETSDNVAKLEGYLQRKKSDVRENGENDDDDDVVMDNKKSPRHDANGIPPEALMNGSKSPSTPRKHDDTGKPASESAAIEKQEMPSRSTSADSDDKISRHSADSAAVISQSRPASAVSSHEGKLPSRPPSSKEVDIVKELMEDSAKSTTSVTPPLEDSKSDKTSRPPSATSIGAMGEAKQPPGSPYGNDTLGNAEHSLKTFSRSSDNSRSSTPSRLETPQNAEREARSPSKTPDKSRSSTPGSGLEPSGNAQVESRTPTKTPDKSRSSTPAGLEPPGSADSKTPSKSPDKSRASTPAELAPSPKESITPVKTPDKSRSATPASSGAEPSNNAVVDERSSGIPDHREADEETLGVKQPSRPTSSLGSSTSIIGRDSKSPKSPKSPRSPTTPESQGKLSAPGSVATPPRSPEETVKGFDNGQQRSLSARTTPSASPRSPTSPKSPAGGGKQPEGEKKRTSFAEDPVAAKKAAEIVEKSSSPTSPSKPATSAAKIRRKATPAKLIDEKTELKSSEKQAVPNGSGGESQAAPTTNGVAESPTKKSPSKSKESDKRSTAGSPTKSPSKSAKSLPRTPETPPSTAQDKKKLPMNKVQVGAAPSPNLKTVRSKIGSLDNASYKPGGGKVKIENRKLDFSKAQPKIAAKNEKYTPSGGDKKISQVKLQWNAKSKIGSLDNAAYKPGGGDKKIETVKLDFKDKAKPKVGSKDNAKHVPGGGAVKSATPPKTPQDAKNDIPMQKIDIKAESKIGSLDNVKHKPGGGDKKIFNDRDYLRQTSSNVESLDGSGSQTQTPVEDNRQLQGDSKANDIEIPQPQPPPSTPTRARHVTSPSSVVTPRAVRNGLAKSPDATTPRRQLAPEGLTVVDGRASKTPSPDATEGGGVAKSRSPRSPTSPRPPSNLRIKSAGERSSPRMSPGTPTKASPGTPKKASPGTPRKASPKELRLPKLASSPTPQEASPATENHSKIILPKLIEPQAARIAY